MTATAFTACGGGGGEGNINSLPESTIKLKGNLPSQSVSLASRLMNFFIPPAYAFSVSDVAKVIVFSRSGYYHISNVASGSFSIDATLNEPVILVFAGATNNFLGYYELPNGLASIPLVNVKSDVTTIDLGALTIAGQVATSANNPLDQTTLDTNAKASMVNTGLFFSALAKNLDADANAVIDILENKYYRIQPLFFVGAQNITEQGQITGSLPTQLVYSYKLAFDFSENKSVGGATSVVFNGGAFSNAVSTQSNTYSTSTTFFSPLVSSNSFAQGLYTIGVNGKTLNFNLPGRSSLDNGVLIPVPTLQVDPTGLLTKISISTFTNNLGQTITNPKSLISSSLQIQIEGRGSACGSYPQSGRMFNSTDLTKVADLSVSPSCSALMMNKIDRIYTVYNDLFGSQYIIGHSVKH
jgi:hypothetical protein